MRSFKDVKLGDRLKFSVRRGASAKTRTTYLDEGEGVVVGFDHADYAKRERGPDDVKLKPHYVELKCADGYFKFTPGQVHKIG